MNNISGRYSELPPVRSGSGRSWKYLLFSAILVLFYFLTFGNILGFQFADRSREAFTPTQSTVELTQSDSRKEIIHQIVVQPPQPPPQGNNTDTEKLDGNKEDDKVRVVLEETGFVQENFDRLEQTDVKLICYVRARYLTAPPTPEKPYNLKHPSYQKTALGKWVRNFYKDKRNLTFVEAGANGGESSNTIELEIELGWRGVLIECNPRVTPDLRSAGRKAWLATVCLSTTAYPQVVNMSIPIDWSYSARLGPAWDLSAFGVNSNWTYLAGIEAVPLFPILASAGIVEVDYFSFDIEGAEFSVLKQFPFDRVLIKVLILEVYFYSPEERKELKSFLGQKGLKFIKGIEMDEIYVHESLLKNDTVLPE